MELLLYLVKVVTTVVYQSAVQVNILLKCINILLILYCIFPGDVNGDGFDDIIIGVLKSNNFYTGGAYIVFGGHWSLSHSQLQLINLPTHRGLAVTGIPWSWAGYSVSGVGDVNGDGLEDVLIGSVPFKSSYGTQITYLVYGAQNISQQNTISLPSLTSNKGAKLIGGGAVVNQLTQPITDRYKTRYFATFTVTDFSRGSGFVITTPLSATTTPTIASTLVPTLTPSCAPTKSPTLLPTQPTCAPTIAPSGPTFMPSFAPSQPSSQPSSYPTVPTYKPTTLTPTRLPLATAAPTIRPTCTPSEAPTHSNTIKPSSSVQPTLPLSPVSVGTTRVPNRQRISRPTATPTTTASVDNNTQHTISITSAGTYSNSNYDMSKATTINYVLDSDGYVRINNTNSRIMPVTYTVLAHPNATLHIDIFNTTTDYFDLQSFSELQTFDQVKIQFYHYSGTASHNQNHLRGFASIVTNNAQLIIKLPNCQTIVVDSLTSSTLLSYIRPLQLTTRLQIQPPRRTVMCQLKYW